MLPALQTPPTITAATAPSNHRENTSKTEPIAGIAGIANQINAKKNHPYHAVELAEHLTADLITPKIQLGEVDQMAKARRDLA